MEAPDVAALSPFYGKAEHMFLGRFSHNLDEKGRMTIPVRFRELLAAGGAYVMQGLDQNLMVLPQPAFQALSERVDHMNMTDPNARMLRRLVYSSAAPVEVDRAGRILLPQFLRESAGLQDAVMVVGMGKYFEIWAPDQWQSQDDALQDADANNRRFSMFDLSPEL